MSKQENSKELTIIPLKIKTTGLMINEGIIPEVSTPVRIDFNHNLSMLENTDIALFELEVLYFVKRENQPDLKVLGCLVENYYQLPNVNDFKDKDGLLMMPTNGFITMVSLSISHARAIVATHCLGTIFEKTLVPVVDPVGAANAFIEAKKQEKGYPIKLKESTLVRSSI